jgi:hypothetical protein
MIYPPTYFDDCHGLIPQTVLSIMALQAGLTAGRKNSFVADNTNALNFTLDSQTNTISVLTLTGYLVIAEARYLLSQQSIVDRVNALNDSNISLLADAIGLPHDSFDLRPALTPVSLPSGINHLSTGELLIEKRLAYLLLHLQKINNLKSLYNFLRFAIQSSTTYTLKLNVAGTAYKPHTQVISQYLINSFLYRLFQTFPDLSRIALGVQTVDLADAATLGNLTQFVHDQLLLPEPALIPFIPIDFLRDLSLSISTTITPTVPTITVIVAPDNQVSGEILSASNTASSFTPNLPQGFNTDDYGLTAKDTSPIEVSPKVDSPLNTDRVTNTLPEC